MIDERFNVYKEELFAGKIVHINEAIYYDFLKCMDALGFAPEFQHMMREFILIDEEIPYVKVWLEDRYNKEKGEVHHAGVKNV